MANLAKKGKRKVYLNEESPYSSGPYLHTYSKYFLPKIDNIVTIDRYGRDLSDLNNQKQLLENNERKFYQIIFPTEPFSGDGQVMLDTFLKQLKSAISSPEDKEVFSRFNNFQAEGRNVYDVMRSFIQVPEDTSSPVYKTMFGNNTSVLTSWMRDEPNNSADTFRRKLKISKDSQSLQNIHFSLTINQNVNKEAKKILESLGKISVDKKGVIISRETINEMSLDIERLFKNAIDGAINGVEFTKQIGEVHAILQERRLRIIDELAENYLATITTRKRNEESRAKDRTKKKQQIVSALNKVLRKPSPVEIEMLFKEPIHEYLKKNQEGYKDSDIDIYMNYVFAEDFQQKLTWSFGEKGTLDKNNQKDVDEAKEKLTYIINNLCVGGSGKLQRAKQMTLDALINVDNFSISFTHTNIPGFLGEFAGAMLYNYLIPEGVSAQVAGQLREHIKGEQNRADIQFMYEQGMITTAKKFYGGIQVKNYQQKTLDKNLMTVNLHPSQFLTEILSASIKGQKNIEQLETLFGNLAMNEDSRNKITNASDILEQLLKNYLSFFLNLYGGTDKYGNPLDTSPFWMIGSGIIIPGSLIIGTVIDELEDQRRTNYKIKVTSTNKKDDGYYEQHPEERSKYWVYDDEEKWHPTDRGFHKAEIADLVYHKNIVSIHSSFNMETIMQNILTELYDKTKATQYHLLNFLK